MNHARAALLTLVMMMVACVAWWGHQAPSPLGEDAPTQQFSAARALHVLDRLVRASPGPHLVGTRENRAVRDAILQEFQALGYPTEIQDERVCQYGRCAQVSNLIVGPTDAPGAVILAAHYDSVASGPGVSDDLAAVAAMVEAARALRDVSTKHPVVFLITDGEEMGLFGAKAFRRHRLANQARVIVNLEARGTRGRSFVFETSAATTWLLNIARASLTAPAVNSLAPAVYDRLPNGSDLTVHKDHGFEGLNFGYFAEVSHYHTPLDDLEHLSHASLQHQGQNALQMTRALAQADHTSMKPGKSVYFDVLGRWVVMWPQLWSWWLAILGMVLWSAAVGLGRQRGHVNIVGVAKVFAWCLAVMLVSVGFGVALDFGWGAARGHALYWRGAREVAVWGHVLATLGICWWGAGRVRERQPVERALGVWGVLGCLALLLAWLLPETSYIFVAPGLVAGAATLAMAWWGARAVALASVVLVVTGGLIWLPLMWSLLDGLELLSSALVTLPMWAWFVTSWGSVGDVDGRPHRAGYVVVGLLWLLCGLWVAMSPRAVAERPEAMNLVTVQSEGEERAEQFWYPTPLDMLGRQGPFPTNILGEGEMVHASKTFARGMVRGMLRRSEADAMPNLKAPTVQNLGGFQVGQTKAFLIKLKTQREATTMFVSLPGGSVWWPPQEVADWSDEKLLSHFRSRKEGMICEGFERDCQLAGEKVVFGVPVDRGLRLVVKVSEDAALEVQDITVSTPEEMGARGAARPDWMVPAHVGDLTVVRAMRRVVP